MRYHTGDKVVISEDNAIWKGLYYESGDILEIEYTIDGIYVVRTAFGVIALYEEEIDHIKTLNMTAKHLKAQAVQDTTKRLLKANNTVTTLEVKTELRVQYPDFFWTQADVSQYMDTLSTSGMLSYTDNGTYRTYSIKGTKVNAPLKAPRKNTKTQSNVLSRKDALTKIQNNRGHYFTATFVKKSDGSVRVLNCQYDKSLNTTPSTQIKVKAGSGQGIKSINLNTLSELRIAGSVYKVK
jgi:hypothetical protein